MSAAIEYLFAQIKRRLTAAGKPNTADTDAACNFAIDANSVHRADLSIMLLEPLSRMATANAKVWQLLGLAYRQDQQMALASRAFDQALVHSPQDTRIAMGKAQIDLETGRPASAQFERIRRILPDNPDVALLTVDALQSEGRADEAAASLSGMLEQNPVWIAGHDAMVRLQTTIGATDPFAGYTKALAGAPKNLALHLAMIRALAQQENWDKVRVALLSARRALGELLELDAIAAYTATETGDHVTAQAMFERAAALRDPGIALYHIRHCLRTGRIEKAERVAAELVQTPAASGALPYLSLAWRLLGDDRAKWLDGDPPYFKIIELDLSEVDLQVLANLLRRLHRSRAHLPEQSVRGGTQTDKPLFHRPEPIIEKLRNDVLEAVRSYIDQLPPFVAGHPLLGTPRTQLLFEGSWSVRLRGSGFHTMHTHPAGWISSALYVSLPEMDVMGPAPAGWLNLGGPPPELNLDLLPYAHVEPKRGRLVLFPSTMWHGTLPFAEGERLTVAFDVRTPLK